MEWRSAIGWNGYSVSDTGLVRNERTGRVLLPFSNHGYARVNMYHGRKLCHVLVHKLVADAFLEKDDERTEIDHINGIRNDNRVSNLRWVTRTENMNTETAKRNMCAAASYYNRLDDYRKKQSEAHASKRKRVRCIETGDVFISLKEASVALGISKSTIGDSCRKHSARLEHMRGKRVYHFEFMEA